MEELAAFLREAGLCPVFSRCLYARKRGGFSGSAAERAKELTGFFKDPEVGLILDVSGGDASNGILPLLDYEAIAESRAVFWGYSDLTAVINALYAKTGKASVLYQARNLVLEEGRRQREAFWGRGGFFDFEYRFIQGSEMAGTVVGGNLRCLLKLAGTPYFPDMKGKLLVLEAMGGSAARIGSGMAQLSQMGAFEQVNGILLGTFLEMEAKDGPSPEELILEYAGNRIPVAKTSMLGHRPDSCALVIGRRLGL